ncbi:MAG: RNA polymerase sigma-70 factor [Candidatus Kryptoniota bacterium]
MHEPIRFSSEREEDVIQSVNRGEETAIEAMFLVYYDGLCRFTQRLTNSRDDVEDLVQDIFVKIWMNREEWNPKGSIRAYLFKAARNQAFNFLKRRKAGEMTEGDNGQLLTAYSDPVEDMIDAEILERISRAIEKLPQGTKLVFTLNRQEGLSYSEIAEVLGISVKTVGNQISRALRHLRKELVDLVKRK